MSAEAVSEPTSPPQGIAARFKAFKEKNHIAFEVAFFLAGFLFDVVLLHRIDSTPLLIHQGTYLVLSSVLIFWDHRISVSKQEPTGLVGKIAGYRLWVMHFFLGTLLNAFMVFYFRASSGLLSFLFLLGLSAIIIANELPQFRSRGPVVRLLLLSFATTSFLAYLLPVVWGSLEWWQYVVAVVIGSIVTWGLWKVFTALTHDPEWTFRRAVLPGLVLQATLLILYVLNVVPPVPLSLKEIHVYSDVVPSKNEQGARVYELSYQPAPGWKFWKKEADTFVAPTGSKAFVFVKIFAPTNFRDQVRFAWDYDDPKHGWTQRGTPYATTLSGGSEEGFRTFAYSTMGKPGKYRVRVLTTDGREIGRETFEYEEGEAPTPVTIED